ELDDGELEEIFPPDFVSYLHALRVEAVRQIDPAYAKWLEARSGTCALGNEGAGMASSRQRLSKSGSEPLPTISFYCACGKHLYSFSNNVIKCEWKFECPKCGRYYECKDSII